MNNSVVYELKTKKKNGYRIRYMSFESFPLSDTEILLIVEDRLNTEYAGLAQGLSSGGLSTCCGYRQQCFPFPALRKNLWLIWTWQPSQQLVGWVDPVWHSQIHNHININLILFIVKTYAIILTSLSLLTFYFVFVLSTLAIILIYLQLSGLLTKINLIICCGQRQGLIDL